MMIKLKVFLFLFFVLAATFSNAAISVDSTLPWMQTLGDTTTCVINNEKFLAEIASVPQFTYTTKTSAQVAADLKSLRHVVTLSTYKTKNPFSKTIAYTYKGWKTVYFNRWKNPRPFPELINTTVHEITHIIGYEHGGNNINVNTLKKRMSVPYLGGKIAEKYALGCVKGI